MYDFWIEIRLINAKNVEPISTKVRWRAAKLRKLVQFYAHMVASTSVTQESIDIRELFGTEQTMILFY